MIYTREKLEPMKMADLKHLSAQSGQISPPTDTKEILITRLLIESAKQPEILPALEQTPQAVLKLQTNTMEQVKNAVNAQILRGMKVFHDKESNSWLFLVQLKSYVIRDSNTGESRVIERWRDDSGTLDQPLTVIKRCAAVLMQNAPTPEQVKPQVNPALNFERVA